jgi:hypothetical protein
VRSTFLKVQNLRAAARGRVVNGAVAKAYRLRRHPVFSVDAEHGSGMHARVVLVLLSRRQALLHHAASVHACRGGRIVPIGAPGGMGEVNDTVAVA